VPQFDIFIEICLDKLILLGYNNRKCHSARKSKGEISHNHRKEVESERKSRLRLVALFFIFKHKNQKNQKQKKQEVEAMKLNMQIGAIGKGFCLEKSISRQIKLTPNGLAERIHGILSAAETESHVLFWKAVGLGDASPCVSITVVADDAIIVSRSFSACVESADDAVKAQLQTVLSDIRKTLCVEVMCSSEFRMQRIS